MPCKTVQHARHFRNRPAPTNKKMYLQNVHTFSRKQSLNFRRGPQHSPNSVCRGGQGLSLIFQENNFRWSPQPGLLVAHDCGYPLSRHTCRATRVAADFLDFIAFCRRSSGVALHPLKILVSHLPPPAVPGGVAPKFGSAKVSRYTGVSQLQLRVSRYTVQLSRGSPRRFFMFVRSFFGRDFPNRTFCSTNDKFCCVLLIQSVPLRSSFQMHDMLDSITINSCHCSRASFL